VFDYVHTLSDVFFSKFELEGGVLSVSLMIQLFPQVR
jgi:hypothetical protein